VMLIEQLFETPQFRALRMPHLDLITQASLIGIGLLSLFLQKLGKARNHQRSANLKLLEKATGELGRIIPVLQLDRFEEEFHISRVRLKPQPCSKSDSPASA
jgi:hypothetical protein